MVFLNHPKNGKRLGKLNSSSQHKIQKILWPVRGKIKADDRTDFSTLQLYWWLSESQSAYQYAHIFLSLFKMFPYLFSHNKTCPQTPLNFNVFKFANSRLQLFIKRGSERSVMVYDTLSRSSLKYLSLCRFDFSLTARPVSKKKLCLTLDSTSKSDVFGVNYARENIWIAAYYNFPPKKLQTICRT